MRWQSEHYLFQLLASYHNQLYCLLRNTRFYCCYLPVILC